MGQSYFVGEKKIRPGTYQRYENHGANAGSGATAHSVAIPIQATWGPVDEVTVHESVNSVTKTYGTDGTVDAALALLAAGAPKIYCIRLNKASNNTSGTDAAAASLSIKDNSTDVLTVTAKYPGTKPLKVQTRVKIEGVSKEIIVFSGDTKVETFSFNAGTDVDEVANLIAAVSSSAYITAAKAEGASVTTVPILTATELTGGADPSVSTESYSEAFNRLEAYSFTHVALDCTTPAVQALTKTWLERVFEEGGRCIAILGGKNKDTAFTSITAAAAAFNSMQVIYSGIWGYDADGNVVDDYLMAAYVAGAIAGTPSNQSIVRKSVPGISTIVPHTNAEYESAILSGLLLASYSPSGAVWFDSGINTLVSLGADQDEGWKKIRRVTTRFEQHRRIDDALSSLVGNVNCDDDGVALAVQAGQGVLNAMIAEGKLKDGALFYEDPNTPREGDSAWFIDDADDYDSLEKIYTVHRHRFSPNS